MDVKAFVDKIKDLLASDKLSEALQILKETMVEGELTDELIVLSAKYKQLEKKARKEVLQEAEINVRRNNIIFEILGILRELSSEKLSSNENEREAKPIGKDQSASQVINNQEANIGTQININGGGESDLLSMFSNK